MHTSYDHKCLHGNAARYCDLCEVEALREERLRLYAQIDTARWWAKVWSACAFVVLGLLLYMLYRLT